MKLHVKFCGMTRRRDCEAAQNLGADFLGFVFVPSSPRSVSLEHARGIRSSLCSSRTVGVFESAEGVEEIARILRLDFVQLYAPHRDELPSAIGVPVLRAFRGVPENAVLLRALRRHPYVLLDKEAGKDQSDFDRCAALPPAVRSRLFLAGGLTPGNVREHVDRIQPYAVDCARGIEAAPGRKSLPLMRRFLSSLI